VTSKSDGGDEKIYDTLQNKGVNREEVLIYNYEKVEKSGAAENILDLGDSDGGNWIIDRGDLGDEHAGGKQSTVSRIDAGLRAERYYGA